MRSRFQAFRDGDVAWLLRTWHPSTRPSVLDLEGNPVWRGLQIVDTVGGGTDDSEGIVEFRATYRADELTRRHLLYQLLPTLEREARATRLDLRPLGEAALRALVGRYALPDAGRQAHLTINDPEGNTVLSTTLGLSEFGAFNTSFPIERSAKLGGYSLLARLDNDTDDHMVYGTFSVAEYRKPAFEVAAATPKDDLIQGDTLRVDVTARYYSGGALANAPVRWRLLADPLYFAPEAAPNDRPSEPHISRKPDWMMKSCSAPWPMAA